MPPLMKPHPLPHSGKRASSRSRGHGSTLERSCWRWSTCTASASSSGCTLHPSQPHTLTPSHGTLLHFFTACTSPNHAREHIHMHTHARALKHTHTLARAHTRTHAYAHTSLVAHHHTLTILHLTALSPPHPLTPSHPHSSQGHEA